MNSRYDVVVIGGGAAGLSAAVAARQKGASVLLVERDRLGGDCTWTGCVPSKALIEHASRVHAARRLGVTVDVDYHAIHACIAEAVTEIAGDESAPVLQRHGIDVAAADARFTSATRLDIGGSLVGATVVIVATGTAPAAPAVPGLSDIQYLTNETVFDLTSLPDRLLVLGGGAVGVELTQAFARLGSAVTLIEAASRLVPDEEPEVAELLQHALARDDATVAVGTDVQRATTSSDGITLHFASGAAATGDALLVATGRQPTTADLSLERAGVATDSRGFIKTDARLRTNVANIYAVGDVTGRLQFTSAADEMGRIAVANALSKILRRRWSPRAVPWAIFTDPEVGRVGMTEAQAFARHGHAARVAYLPLDQTDRARTTGRRAGFVKLVAGPRSLTGSVAGGRLLGATVVSPAAAEVIQEAAFAIQTRALTARLAQTVHAYPSWSTALRQAAAQFVTTTAYGSARPARP